jgi:hypothetical protein
MHIDGANTAARARIARISARHDSAYENLGLRVNRKQVLKNWAARWRCARPWMVQFAAACGPRLSRPRAR